MSAAVGWVIAQGIRLRFDRGQARDLEATFGLRLRARSGRAPARFAVRISGGACEVRRGPAREPGAAATLAFSDLIRLATRRAGWPELLSSGRLELTGDPFLALRFPSLFRFPVSVTP